MKDLDTAVYDSAEAISSTIVTQIAERERVDPTELTPPLQHIVDTDALNRLFAEGRDQNPRVEFDYREYEVTVEGPTQIQLTPNS